MKPRELAVLLLLAAIWGASFMFIKVALDEGVGPVTLVAIRLALGAAGLVVIYAGVGLGGRRTANAAPAAPVPWRRLLVPFIIAAMANAVVPYLCLSWGEQYIPSGNAAILNATTPLWTALIVAGMGARMGAERLPWNRALGIGVGFLGVIALVGGSGSGGSQDLTKVILGHVAVLVTAISYAAAGLYARHAFKGLPTLVPALGQTLAAALLLVPVAWAIAPLTVVPSPGVIAALLALGLGGTAFAYVLYFHLLATVGATRTLLVTYLLPGTALVYGVLFLHESIGPQSLLGLALVLVGIAITTGGVAGWRAARKRATN